MEWSSLIIGSFYALIGYFAVYYLVFYKGFFIQNEATKNTNIAENKSIDNDAPLIRTLTLKEVKKVEQKKDSDFIKELENEVNAEQPHFDNNINNQKTSNQNMINTAEEMELPEYPAKKV